VAVGPQAEESARAVGVPIDSIIIQSLNHIRILLPGPATDIGISIGSQVIPELGVTGYTSPSNGQIAVILDPTSQIPYAETLRTWLPAVLSHEVNHAVRILGGPGFGPSLDEALITEGMATAFDSQAWPGLVEPWMNAIGRSQEMALWAKMQPSLHTSGVAVYDDWFFGSSGIPRWTGFTIGYHIVTDYLRRHPQATAASLVHLRADAVLSGSDYQP
jgi:uncharacterized protein YjaZ